jgi:hypothetical protein
MNDSENNLNGCLGFLSHPTILYDTDIILRVVCLIIIWHIINSTLNRSFYPIVLGV